MRRKYEKVLEDFREIISRQEIEFEEFNGSKLIEGEIDFISNWRLEFMEFKSEDKHKYRFHLMNEGNEMVVRWDTAPHHPELENFPFHKHSRKKQKPESTEELEGQEIQAKVMERNLENL